ncbi:hypothetical protein GALMADRAFT_277410 [Galerina marginata CBS 339.88]|uniref:Transmembrane protein n=1 Tax=Galerina marginata (strain CBS 339.88) TaxID=685588 RepID=A0A067TJP6_GALM3|nr:hypothetical protein GALMADRAFT_277410 [Galerina marginata CBS 339.88]
MCGPFPGNSPWTLVTGFLVSLSKPYKQEDIMKRWMRPSTRRRGLSLLMLLFCGTHTGVSVALPQPAITAPPTVLPVRPRADAEFLTTYGFFDSPTSSKASLAAGGSALAPIPEVFLAMAQETGRSTSSPVKLAQTAPLTVPASVTSSAVFPTESPPMRGPGLVVLTNPLPTMTQSIPGPTVSGNSESSSSISNRTASSRRMVVLGSVIGSILLFTVFLFFLLDPSISRKAFRFFCKSRKSRAKKIQREKATPAVHESWVSVVYLPNTNDQTFTEEEKHDVRARDKETSDPYIQNHIAPSSKFSVCSSLYVDSPGDSEVYSGISAEMERSAVNPRVSFAPGQKPVRPPRPPTADSPALSDSVYLACSDKPYVIVAPGTFSQINMDSMTTVEAPKRNLTPSEFFALHVPGLLASLSTSSSWRKKADRISAISEKRGSHVTKRETNHSRTRSEPMLHFPKAQRKSNVDSEYDYVNDSDVQDSMVQRLMKHRRSRSASGWAYPDRPKSRRQYNS